MTAPPEDNVAFPSSLSACMRARHAESSDGLTEETAVSTKKFRLPSRMGRDEDIEPIDEFVSCLRSVAVECIFDEYYHFVCIVSEFMVLMLYMLSLCFEMSLEGRRMPSDARQTLKFVSLGIIMSMGRKAIQFYVNALRDDAMMEHEAMILNLFSLD
jgi:hypothetical protein